MGVNVLILSRGPDNGGVGIGIKRAFDRFGKGWEVRVAAGRRIWFGWDTDLLWDSRVPPLFARADVVHMMESPAIVEALPGWERKPRILHHHGAIWRANADAFATRCTAEGVTAYGATFEIAATGMGWLPHPVDLDQMTRLRRRPGSLLTIAQSPSARSVNDTDVLTAAFATGRIPARLRLIEHMPWRAHLAAKAQADAVFDSLGSGYGMTLAEAWGLGLPGIAGSDDPVTMQRMTDELGEVPYHPVTRAGLVDELRAFALDAGLRSAAAERGQRVLNAHHAEKAIVARLSRVYREAIG